MVDLSKELTVAIICGSKNPNQDLVLECLEKQDCEFTFIKIEHKYPMNVAFQAMLDECKTPYLIQVDNDMVLHLNSIKKMYDNFSGNASPENIVMDCYFLRDVHLDMNIYGIKIYKMDIFRKYPYKAGPSCEVEQLERMKKDGYDIRFKNDVMGEHSPHWTNEGIFERYYNLGEKFKLYRYIWTEQLPKKLFEMVKENPSEKNIFAFAGCLASVYSDSIMNEEKDFSKKRKEYGKLQAFLEEPHQATLYVGETCNFSCDFCMRQHSELEKAPDMTPELAEKVIGRFPNIKGICLCGFTETFTSKNLVPILQVLKRANKYVGIITNGSLITKRFNEIKGWYQPNYISVSLNAHNQEEHEKITHTKTWNTVLEGIKLVVNSNIDCYVSSVITLENIKHIPDFLKLVNSLGVKTVHLHNLLPHFANKEDDKYFWNNVLQREHQSLIDELKKLPEANIVKSWPILISNSGGKNACQFPWYSLSVNGNGSISYCNSVLPADKKFGSINDFVVWNSKQAQEFREKFCKKELPHCKMCFRNFDMGF